MSCAVSTSVFNAEYAYPILYLYKDGTLLGNTVTNAVTEGRWAMASLFCTIDITKYNKLVVHVTGPGPDRNYDGPYNAVGIWDTNITTMGGSNCLTGENVTREADKTYEIDISSYTGSKIVGALACNSDSTPTATNSNGQVLLRTTWGTSQITGFYVDEMYLDY